MQALGLAELFAQQVHISRLKQVLGQYTSLAKQAEILEELHNSGAPPSYQYKVLDLLTRQINNSTSGMVSDDISEAHAQALISCMAPPGRGGGGGLSMVGDATPVIYRFEGHCVVINEERDTLAKAGGTGYRTWEAALALGDFFLKNPLEEKNVIELGAGTGFVSRLLKELGHNTLSTDGDAAILENLVGLPVTGLWWDTKETEELAEFKANLPFKNYVLVAADVLYDPNNYAPFLFTVSKLLQTNSYAVVATTMRNRDTYALLNPECERVGLEITHLGKYGQGGLESKYFYLNDETIEIIKLTLR